MTHHYLIGWTTEHGKFGCTEINRPEPIREMDDVEVVMRDLRKHYGYPNLIVSGFSRFED
jgi:hypothetical protein